MPCLHRFHNELLPAKGVTFLFIGTFNPIWNVKKGENPDFFYSRSASEFWCILPHAFKENCIVDKGRNEKEEFCSTFNIALTDIIYCINNVDENNEMHKKYLTKGFKDEDLEQVENNDYILDVDFFTPHLEKYIADNAKSLKGVFFTRKTGKNIPRIRNEWNKIESKCLSLNIYAKALPSPSPRGGGIRNKILEWRSEIAYAVSTEAADK